MAGAFELGSAKRSKIGPVHTTQAVATGANFWQFEERGVTHTGCLLTTIDEEMGKIGPVPSGCGENPPILRCRPRIWNHQSLRTPPRLGRFSRATPSTSVV